MPKAPTDPERSGQPKSSSDAMDLLRALSIGAGEAPRSPDHPDAELLGLCGAVLDLTAEARAIDREARKMTSPNIFNPRFTHEMEKRRAKENEARAMIGRAGKLRARTAAGIYGKAVLLRNRNGKAPALALSLATDLGECPGFRSMLWPAKGG